MKFTTVMVALLLLLAPFPNDQYEDCETGVWKRHNALDVVFRNFPNRINFNVDGYIASENCENIGRTGTLLTTGGNYSVSVFDCLNRASTPPPEYRGDIGFMIWYHAKLPKAPAVATICWRDN